jgi:hypothetical protein
VLETLRAFLWPSGCLPGSFAARATRRQVSHDRCDADSGSQFRTSRRSELGCALMSPRARPRWPLRTKAADQLRPWAFEEGFLDPGCHSQSADARKLQRGPANVYTHHGAQEIDFQTFDPSEGETHIASEGSIYAGPGRCQPEPLTSIGVILSNRGRRQDRLEFGNRIQHSLDKGIGVRSRPCVVVTVRAKPIVLDEWRISPSIEPCAPRKPGSLPRDVGMAAATGQRWSGRPSANFPGIRQTSSARPTRRPEKRPTPERLQLI